MSTGNDSHVPAPSYQEECANIRAHECSLNGTTVRTKRARAPTRAPTYAHKGTVATVSGYADAEPLAQ